MPADHQCLFVRLKRSILQEGWRERERERERRERERFERKKRGSGEAWTQIKKNRGDTEKRERRLNDNMRGGSTLVRQELRFYWNIS